MKIAILTLYYHNYNYGGLLQAYALQKALSFNGNEVRQISYDLLSGYSNNQAKLYIKRIVHRALSYCPGYRTNRRLHEEKIGAFADQVPHTKVVTASTIDSLSDDFDLFVFGSDQIWNPIGWQPTLFGSFLPKDKKRISYAASISRDQLTIEELDFIGKYINDFAAVSVREKRSAEILKDAFPELHVDVMPDPVFLLTKEEWERVADVDYKKDEKYIAAYFLGDDTKRRDECISYAKKNNLNIYFIATREKSTYSWELEHKESVLDVSVPQFLGLIHNAELVLTDSFHGTAFASIFLKNHYIFKRFKDNDKASMNSRIVTLTNELGTTGRVIDNTKEIKLVGLEMEEKETISERISGFRDNGIKYLKDK